MIVKEKSLCRELSLKFSVKVNLLVKGTDCLKINEPLVGVTYYFWCAGMYSVF